MVILNLSIEEPRNTSSSTNDNHFEASSQSNATLLRDIETSSLNTGTPKNSIFSSDMPVDQPVPLHLPTDTRLKLIIKNWTVAAAWKWVARDETCGICRMPFEACCVTCKTPGDECPLAVGICQHAFHMHCIVKWTETQNTPRPQCPLCRQEWKFAPG